MNESEMRIKIIDFLTDLEEFLKENYTARYAESCDNVELALDILDSQIAANLRALDPERKKDE